MVYLPGAGFTGFHHVATDIILGSGALEYVLSGSTAISTSIDSSGIAQVYVGGVIVSATVTSGGFDIISGGTATGTILNGGTDSTVEGEGTGTDQLHHGEQQAGFEIVSTGGKALSAVVNNMRAVDEPPPPHQPPATTVSNGGP